MRWDEAKEIKLGDVIRVENKKQGGLLAGAVIGMRFDKGTVIVTVEGGSDFCHFEIIDVEISSSIKPRRGIEDAQRKGGSRNEML